MGIPGLVISDGHTGIRGAVLICFPESAWEYCHVHFMRNMMKHIPRKRWSGIGIVKQALENPDLLPIAEEYLMCNNMEKAADMSDKWHSSLQSQECKHPVLAEVENNKRSWALEHGDKEENKEDRSISIRAVTAQGCMLHPDGLG